MGEAEGEVLVDEGGPGGEVGPFVHFESTVPFRGLDVMCERCNARTRKIAMMMMRMRVMGDGAGKAGEMTA